MKTLSHVLTVLLCCWATLASAQCGVQAYFTDTLNPNNTTVFHNGSTVTNGTFTSYLWNFGDGSSSTAANPDHHYAQPGNYTVCLVVTAQVTNSPGTTCMDSFCKTISVACASGLQISTTHTSGNNYATYTVATTGGTGPYTYAWSNGSTTATTTVQYNVAGSYSLCVTVTDASGCAISECETANVTSIYSCNGLDANFVQTVSTNTVAVQSTTANATSNTLYRWYLDGLPYTNATVNPGYTFANIPAGMHSICLYVYAGSANYLCDSVCHSIFIPGTGPCSGAQADFSYDATATTLMLDAHADHYPAGTQFQWWLDGNGSTPASGASTYLYQNLSAGTHQVCLYIYTNGGDFCDSTCQTITVGSGCNVNMNAIFTASSTTTSTLFVANTNPSGTVYHWNFGDGTDANTNTPQTQHQYPSDTNTHVYTVCLITRIPGTVCADTFCTVVTVPGSVNNGNCQASFVYAFPQNIYTAAFIDNSQGAVSSWFWNFGDGSPNSTDPNPSHMFMQPGTFQVCLTIGTSDGCTSTMCDIVTIEIEQPSNDTICGIVFSDANSNGVMDSSEAPLPGVIVMAGNYTAVSDSDGFYHIVYPGTFAVEVHAQAPQGCSPTLPVIANNSNTNVAHYYIAPNGALHGCGYNFGFNCNVTTICGVVYFDANSNGMQDVGENGLPNIHVELGSNGHTYHAYTNQNGSYCVTVPTGTYVIHAAGANYNTCALTPAQISVAATTVGQYYGNNNFAIYCQPGSCNLEVTLTPHTTVTPGFQAWYDVTVRNVGATPATGTANLFYDASLSFISASPAASSHNASTQTLSFNLPNLMPGGSAYYYVKFNASQSLALNTPIFTLANVIASCNDVNLTNNVDTIHQNVTGSWDPNNKLAYVTNYETNPAYQYISSIDANQRIEYVINFQNEGNGPAVNVVIKDLITTDLDVSSFELLGTSHPCQVTLNGNDANFKFSNIMLAAKATDEPNSHGFVKFAINANSNLAQGHVIVDDAAIYFDYNEPVITNEAEVTLLGPNSIKDVNAVAATIAPNPMQQYTTIKLSNTNAEGFKMRVTDLTGRVVSEGIASSNTFIFDRGSLSSGLYTYQIIQNNKAVANGKLVIQ